MQSNTQEKPNSIRCFFKKIHDLFWVSFPFVLAAVFALVLTKASFPNSDTFFIIATGEHIVENGVVPTVNPFVIHEGFGTIVQQWLFDVLIYQIYSFGGNVGLYLYSAAVLLVSLFMMYKFFGLYSKNVPMKLLVLSFCAILASFFVVARPTSLSFLMCLSVVMVMETYRRNKKPLLLLLLPAISLLTINLHASMWPMLFVLMVPFIFPDKLPKVKELGLRKSLGVFIKEWFDKWKWALLAMLGMFLVGLINPNGINGMGYVFLSYGSATSANFIAELQAPTLTTFIGILVVISILLCFKYIDKFRSKMDFAKFYMAAGTIILAATHNRNLWFLFFGTIPLFFVFFDKFTWKIKSKDKTTGVYAILDACYLCIILALCTLPITYGSLEIVDSGSSPVEAVAYLDDLDDASKDEVVLFTEFNNGAYMQLNDYKVYIDARPELFQKNVNGKEDIYTEYLMVRTGVMDFEEFFNKYNFTHLLVDDGTPLSGFLKAYDGCKLAVDGDGYCLYEFN